jgi:hypothetical protein
MSEENLHKKPPKPQKGQFIDVDTITSKNIKRIHDCAKMLMHRHEHLFSKNIPNRIIFVKEYIKREDLDIPQIFDFPDELYYVIYRIDDVWYIRIMFGNRMLIEAGYNTF